MILPPAPTIEGYGRILAEGTPTARANLRGSTRYPGISGTVLFYPSGPGVLVAAQVAGLPTQTGQCRSGVFGFHIHEGGSCTGTAADPFASTGMHFSPVKCPHPHHAGDLPPLFENRGRAFLVVFTDRFTIPQIIGRTVVIHSQPDDFTTQPAGNSGVKIACGPIRSLRRIPSRV